MPRCPNCKNTKNLREFGKDKQRKDGRRIYCKQCTKLFWADKKEKFNAAKMQKYYTDSEHRRKVLDRNHAYTKTRCAKDPGFKIRKNLNRRLHHALKGVAKSVSTLELIGCSVENLRNHLQSLFQEGMTWQNYGMWQIDHIRPCASFDLSKLEHQKACFNFQNLQPLWAKDNLFKSNKL